MVKKIVQLFLAHNLPTTQFDKKKKHNSGSLVQLLTEVQKLANLQCTGNLVVTVLCFW